MPFRRHSPASPYDQPGLTGLLLSDYRAYCSDRPEGRGQRAMLLVPRLLTDVSLHAALLVRLITRSRPWTSWFWRNVLVAKHAMDIRPDVSVGPGLVLPHPIGIVIAPGTIIGRDVTICHNVTLGVRRVHSLAEFAQGRLAPRIEDGVFIFPGTVVVGPITVGAGATVGANLFVDRDVPPKAVLHGGGGSFSSEPR